jgi:hypothetical protein
LQYGGDYWFGRAYDDCFWLEFERPTSLGAGIDYIMAMRRVEPFASLIDDDFHLE